MLCIIIVYIVTWFVIIVHVKLTHTVPSVINTIPSKRSQYNAFTMSFYNCNINCAPTITQLKFYTCHTLLI